MTKRSDIFHGSGHRTHKVTMRADLQRKIGKQAGDEVTVQLVERIEK
jgi:hypothetical protein